VRRRNRQERTKGFDGGAGRLAGAISRHPREFVGSLMAAAAIFAIFLNALFLQHGPHPAPIFATRPLMTTLRSVALPQPRAATPAVAPASVARSQMQIVGDIQRELGRRGFYDGVVDGIWGAKTDAAARDFIHATGMKINAEASGALLHVIVNSNAKAQSDRVILSEPARSDPIAALIAPTKQVLAIQRALADFGYGQIKPTGVYDAQTQGAIEKFERDRRLPVTGQISDRLVRELAAMTGRPLE
jgi:peptidoglycan hydrolase-like protein with peptidoglycan-binding domain